MKKVVAVLAILCITIGLVFAVAETSDFTLTTSVAESPLNTGIRIRSGDLTDLFTNSSDYAVIFTAEFGSPSSVNSLAVNTGLDSAQEDAFGYFTVLVQRQQNNPVTVTIDATPLRIITGEDSYLGYRITGQWTPTLLISTVDGPGFPVEGITYQADRKPHAGAFIRDYRVFKYEIPKDRLAAVGTYRANVSFTISVD